MTTTAILQDYSDWRIIMTFKANGPQETIDFAEKIGKLLKKGDVIAYTGGLGAGKTTFTRGLAIGMGLGDNVTSPTFSLVTNKMPLST